MSITVEIDTTSTETTAASLRRIVAMAKAASLAVDATKTNAPDMTRGVDRRNTMVQAHISNGSNGKSKHDFGPLFASFHAAQVARVSSAPKTAPRIQALVARTEAFTVWEADITPEVAREWLKRNHDSNRKARAGRLETYRKQMIAGDWRLTHQGVAFDRAGVLVDGQHRLRALASCPDGTVIRVMVFQYNEDTRALGSLDLGASRCGADSLAIDGYVDRESAKNTAAVLNSIFQAVHRSTSAATSAELAALYTALKADVDWSVANVRKGRISAPIVAAFAYAHPVAPARVEQVAEMVITAVGLEAGTAEHTLHRFINDGTSYGGAATREPGGSVNRGGAMPRLDATYKTLAALRAAVLGAPTKRLYGIKDDTMPAAMTFFMERRAALGLSTGKAG